MPEMTVFLFWLMSMFGSPWTTDCPVDGVHDPSDVCAQWPAPPPPEPNIEQHQAGHWQAQISNGF